jgi:hypothetical protein
MRELTRRAEPDADRLNRLRQMRERWRNEDGDDT